LFIKWGETDRCSQIDLSTHMSGTLLQEYMDLKTYC